ncbi:MAG: molybdenum cofactor guanylyltransferase [Gammaproteobacteria bacterium]|nr:MAG: molybdenum cofactor guanylyltransferase [Gammaproteobacteria bacterium]
MVTKKDITAIILAGGKGRRLGGIDKGLLELNQRPLIEYVIDSISPQVAVLAISANRNQDKYSGYGVDVIADLKKDYQGPLSGLASVMGSVRTSHVLAVPCDMPGLPADLVERMTAALNNSGCNIAVVHDGKRIQNVLMLMATELHKEINTFLASGGRAVKDWLAIHDIAVADFNGSEEQFGSINTQDDVDRFQFG